MKLKQFIILLAVICVFTACRQAQVKGVASSAYEDGDITKVKVTAQNCNVRSGVSNQADVVNTVDQNTTFDVINQVNDWYAVQLPDNTVGFVPTNECQAVIDPSKKATTAQTNLNTGAGQNTQNAAPDTSTTPKTTGANKNDTANSSPTLSAQEQEMLKLINDARAQNNLPALKIDMEITNVARIKAQDMIDNNYFSHNSPTYGSPFDMMKSFGIQYVKAGENIAGNQTVQAAHEALMNSPGHRANILSPDYTHVGIGIKSGGQYGNMFSQMFASMPQ